MAPVLLSEPAAWPQGFELAAAIEQAIGPLDALFAICVTVRKIQARELLALRFDGSMPPADETAQVSAAFDREWAARVSAFQQKLHDGDWLAGIRQWRDITAPLKLLRPEETSQLHIIVPPRSARSLWLYRGNDRLFGVFWPKHMTPPAELPVRITNSQAQSAATKKLSMKAWLAEAIKLHPPPVRDARTSGWLKEYAQRLRSLALKEKRFKKTPEWTSIRNALSSFDF